MKYIAEDVIKKAYEETRKEIGEDKQGFFNAISAIEVFKKKIQSGIKSVGVIDQPHPGDVWTGPTFADHPDL